CMSLPLEMNLISTADGPRLAWKPVPMAAAIAYSELPTSLSIQPGQTKSLVKNTRGLLRVDVEFEPGADSELKFNLDGVPITYGAQKQELNVNGHRAAAPLRDGKQK